MRNESTALLDVGAFLVELAMLVAAGWGGYRWAGGGLRGAGAAIAVVVAFGLLWGLWMAPTAEHPVPAHWRPVLGCGFILVAAGLAYRSGLHTRALVFGVVGMAITVAAELART